VENYAHVIYIPGLGDQKTPNKLLANLIPFVWGLFGFSVHILRLNWEDGKPFSSKLQIITKKVDELSRKDFSVYLLGVSAGGSAALNAYCERRGTVRGVASLAGRLCGGRSTKHKLESFANRSPAFLESVLLFEKTNLRTLSEKDKSKIITIRPLTDNIVPVSTVSLDGATNIQIQLSGHLLACGLFPTVFVKSVLNFFKDIPE
jgi:hypothetical protein